MWQPTDRAIVVLVKVWPFLTGTLVLGYGWWVTTLRPFSAGATVAVVGSGIVAILFGLRARDPRRRCRLRRGIGVWVFLVLALAGLQLAAYVQHPRSEHPTLSVITNAALEPDPIRAVAFVAWLAFGAWVAAR